MTESEMYLSRFSDSTEALDLSRTPEFTSLCESAGDLGIRYKTPVTYESRNTVVRHQRFHFLSWGDPSKPTIILLHGSNQSAHSWDLVSLNLSENYHVLALDQRGHGDSEWNRGADYSIAEMSLDAEAFIKARTSERVILIGHSMGGMVSLMTALRCTDLLRALVCVDIGPEVNEEGSKMIHEFVGRNIEFDDMETFLDRVAEYDQFRSREHIERTLKYNLIRRADGKYVTKADRRRVASSRPQFPLDDVAALHLPTLVVRGEQSNVLAPEAAVRFSGALPAGELVVVPDCGHNVASQNTPGFLAALRPFLAKLT